MTDDCLAIHCFHCKKDYPVPYSELTVLKTSNNRSRVESVCAECGQKRSRLISKQHEEQISKVSK